MDIEGGESGEDAISWEGECGGRGRRRGVGDAQCGGGGDGGGAREGGGGGVGREEC